jgi:hypothetical protein
MKTFVVNHQDVENEIKDTISLINKINISNNFVYNVDNKSLISNSKLNAITFSKNENQLRKNLINLLFDSFIKCESSYPESGKLFLQLFNYFFDSFKDIDYDIELKNNINFFLDTVNEKSIYANKDNLITFLKSNINDTDINLVLLHLLDIANILDKVNIDNNFSTKNIIEYQNGCTFNIQQLDLFPIKDKTTRINCKCLIIDGIIENISEIDNILQLANKNNETIIIFAISFSNDVLSTLMHNYKRKTLDVIPVSLGVEVETINSLKDISVVCNGRFVSSQFGDVVSLVKFDDLTTIDKIIFNRNNITIINAKSESNIQTHLNNLNRKIIEEKNDDVKDLMEKRVLSLTSNFINVKVKSLNDQDKLLKLELLNKGLKLIKCVIDNGIVKFDDNFFKENKKKNLMIFNFFKENYYNELFPVVQIMHCLKHSRSCFNIFKSLGPAILLDIKN